MTEIARTSGVPKDLRYTVEGPGKDLRYTAGRRDPEDLRYTATGAPEDLAQGETLSPGRERPSLDSYEQFPC
jgi:hypothetical protein